MPIELFGFSFGRKNANQLASTDSVGGIDVNKNVSFVPPADDDGAAIISGGGHFGQYLDLDGSIKNEADMISKYRSMSLHPEIEQSVEDIINESIVHENRKQAVNLILDETDFSSNIQKKIEEEFSNILHLLNFKNKGTEIYRRWYIDGRLYFHIIVDQKSTKKGIVEIRPVDAMKMKKMKEVQKAKTKNDVDVITDVKEYYIYMDNTYAARMGGSMPLITQQQVTGVRIAPEAICHVNSGLFDHENKRIIGYLHKAIKPLNQLRMVEDAVVIYRISRAPERRIFYIDVGSLPKTKAEQYLRDIMNKYRHKLVYDVNTGEMRDDKRHMSMLEDFWLPRREGGRGTEISTLDGGQNLGEMEDVEYFKKKLFRSLNVPVSRMESETGFNLGKSTEITRDEVKFSKFIDKLRSKFSDMFIQLLKTQLILKGIITEDDWSKNVQSIYFDYNRDSYFTELKNSEILKERLDILREMDEYTGKYYSKEYVRKNVLHQSELEIEEMDKQIEKEKAEEPQEEDDF